MDATTAKLLSLFAVIGIGLAVGKITWRGMSLGTSGVVFAALAAGHFGFQVPQIAGVVGVVLFVYCLGVGAGPSFLRMFFHQGKSLAALALAMIVSAGLVALIVGKLLALDADLAVGTFAGALTSTPALAAAAERLPADSEVAVGFGVAYLVGVVGVILFVQVAPRMLRRSGNATHSVDADNDDDGPITRVLVQVMNPSVLGKRLRDVAIISRANCQISRLLIDGKLQPIPKAFRLALDQQVLVVGAERRLQEVVEVLGEERDDVHYLLDLEHQRRRIVATSKELTGRTLAELHLLSRFGVTISRITREDVEFVPSPQSRVQFGDALTAVGEPDSLDKFVEFAGHRERTLDETDLISLAVGLVLGILVGQVELAFNGEKLSLGMAGGPLLVGLLMGHFGRIGPFVGRMPRPARLLLAEIGLALFLAQAGSQAGDNFVAVFREHGFSLFFGAVIILAVPLLVGIFVSRFIPNLGALEIVGGICGAMTSTPGLGAVMSKTESSLPATSYAAVYPLALILVTILAPLLISQFS